METLTALIVFFIIVLFVVVIFFLIQKRLEDSGKSLLEEINRNRNEIETKFQYVNDKIDAKLGEIQTSITRFQSDSANKFIEQFKSTSELIQDVTKKLTDLQNTNKQVLDLTRQLESLQKILQNPKHRGLMGEKMLEVLLSEVLPEELYEMQYTLTDSQKVDAIIKLNNHYIPVDAKFSLENFKRIMENQNNGNGTDQIHKEFEKDVKKRIEETAKYINTGKNTTNFAIMFVPAEGVYHYILEHCPDSVNLAYKKKVIITSPMTFYAYLQAILQGHQHIQIQKHINEIIEKIVNLKDAFNKFGEEFTRVGKSLNSTVNHYNKTSRVFSNIDKKINEITSGKVGGDFISETVDKPEIRQAGS